MDEQKKKINNLIDELSNKLKKICNKGSKGSPKWEFCDDVSSLINMIEKEKFIKEGQLACQHTSN